MNGASASCDTLLWANQRAAAPCAVVSDPCKAQSSATHPLNAVGRPPLLGALHQANPGELAEVGPHLSWLSQLAANLGVPTGAPAVGCLLNSSPPPTSALPPPLSWCSCSMPQCTAWTATAACRLRTTGPLLPRMPRGWRPAPAALTGQQLAPGRRAPLLAMSAPLAALSMPPHCARSRRCCSPPFLPRIPMPATPLCTQVVLRLGRWQARPGDQDSAGPGRHRWAHRLPGVCAPQQARGDKVLGNLMHLQMRWPSPPCQPGRCPPPYLPFCPPAPLMRSWLARFGLAGHTSFLEPGSIVFGGVSCEC